MIGLHHLALLRAPLVIAALALANLAGATPAEAQIRVEPGQTVQIWDAVDNCYYVNNTSGVPSLIPNSASNLPHFISSAPGYMGRWSCWDGSGTNPGSTTNPGTGGSGSGTGGSGAGSGGSDPGAGGYDGGCSSCGADSGGDNGNGGAGDSGDGGDGGGDGGGGDGSGGE